MARVVVDVKNTIGIEQGTITTTGTDSDRTRIHSVGFIALEYTGAPPSALVISATTSTGKTLNVSYVAYNTANYRDISYDPNAWLTNPCTADLSGKSNVHYIATIARNSNNSNISPSDITAWMITYDNGIAFEIGDSGYPEPIDAPEPTEYAMTAPYPDSVFRIDPAYNYGYPFTALMPDIEYTPPHPPEPGYEEETVVQYDIYCDDKLMHSSVVPENEYKVIDPVLDLQDSAAGSLEFSLPPFNCMYGKCQMMMSTIRVERNGKEIWEGRPVSFKEDMWLNHAITCEGELAYLNDIYQEQNKYENKTLQQILGYVIAAYNARAAANRQFTLGWIEDEKYTSDLLDITIPFQTTLETINSLCKTYGLHVYMRNTWDENGVKTRRICFKGTDLGQNPSQVIEFGTNLTDYAKSYNFAELVTAVLPLGAKSDKAGATVKDTDDVVDAKASGFEQGSIVTATPNNPSGNYTSTSRVRTTNYLTLPASADSIKVTAALTEVSGVTTQINIVGYNANKEQTFIENEWYNSPHELNVSSYATTKYYRIVLKYSNSADLTPENVASCSVNISKTRKGTPYGGTYGRYYVIWPSDGYDSRNDRQHPNPEYYHHAGDIVNISAISDFPGDKSRYFVNEYTLTAETATVYITAQMQGGAGMVVIKNQGNSYFIKKSSKNGMTAWSDFKFNGWYSQFTGEVKMYVGCYDSQSATDDTHGLIIYNSKVVDKGLEEYVTVEGISEYDEETHTGNPNIKGKFVIDSERDHYDDGILPVESYGRIERKIEWPDAKDAWTLYNNAITYLRSGQFDGLEISLSAVDMAMLGVNCSQLYPGELVMVKCQPYGLEKPMPVSQVKIPLSKPENTQFNVGDRRKQSLTSVNTATNSEILSMIAEKPSMSAVLSAAKSSAAEYLKDTQNGYVTFKYAEDGHIEAMIVSDTQDYRQSPHGYWIFGKHGIGFVPISGDPNDPLVAMTDKGAIVADRITTGTLNADLIRAGTMSLGYWLDADGHTHASGNLEVLSSDGNVIMRVNDDDYLFSREDTDENANWIKIHDHRITFGREGDGESTDENRAHIIGGDPVEGSDKAIGIHCNRLLIGSHGIWIRTWSSHSTSDPDPVGWDPGWYPVNSEYQELRANNYIYYFFQGILMGRHQIGSGYPTTRFKVGDTTYYFEDGLLVRTETDSNNE